MSPSSDTGRMAVDRVHPVRMQLRHRRPTRRPHAGQDPRRQGPSGVAGLHLQQGAAPGPLPEQPHPADLADASHAPTAATRKSTGTPRSPRSPRASSASATPTAGTRSSTTAAAVRATTSAARTAAHSSRRSARATAPMRWRRRRPGKRWVDAQLYGGHTRGEFEHAEVSVFIGKNPWMSQSFPRARTVLNEIAKDPTRSMIVIDPVITDTAKMADFHLRVRPGTDAWCLAALAAVLVQENLCDEAFLAEHVTGVEPCGRCCARSPVGDYALRCGVDEELLRAAARRIAAADKRRGVRGSRHAAGTQQHAVLLPEQAAVDPHRKLRQTRWPASAFVVRAAVPLRGGVGRTPVTGAPIIAGLIPSNVGAAGNPDRPSRSVPGDDRGEQQPGAFTGRLRRVPRGVRARWNCWWSSTSR